MKIPYLAFVGFSNSGKTTLASQVVAQLKQKGYRIGVLKHDVHDAQLDIGGKDTSKYSEVGTDMVIIASATKLNIWERSEKPLALTAILQRFSNVDMIIIEGYKQEQTPKILVARNAEQLALHKKLSGLLAIATTLCEIDTEERTASDLGPLVPLLNLNDVHAVTAFVENWFHSQ